MMTQELYCLKWNLHKSTLLDEFESLFATNELTDCILVSEGQQMRVHKIILSSCSAYFKKLFDKCEDKCPMIIFNDITFRELRYIIEYMYRGEVNIEPDMLQRLLRVAHALHVKGLADEPPSCPPVPPVFPFPRTIGAGDYDKFDRTNIWAPSRSSYSIFNQDIDQIQFKDDKDKSTKNTCAGKDNGIDINGFSNMSSISLTKENGSEIDNSSPMATVSKIVERTENKTALETEDKSVAGKRKVSVTKTTPPMVRKRSKPKPKSPEPAVKPPKTPDPSQASTLPEPAPTKPLEIKPVEAESSKKSLPSPRPLTPILSSANDTPRPEISPISTKPTTTDLTADDIEPEDVDDLTIDDDDDDLVSPGNTTALNTTVSKASEINEETTDNDKQNSGGKHFIFNFMADAVHQHRPEWERQVRARLSLLPHSLVLICTCTVGLFGDGLFVLT
ncbi:protein abrupt-like isoform X1 [Cimex lectularius]|uniref:BTB domain-containing protein n=1 Tax=Cimex lectularius TaxID=79782 RepID=A0A8I6TI03_CIMLE|nr:protein abrupt-like isoform X1 [Cimex lectularius]